MNFSSKYRQQAAWILDEKFNIPQSYLNDSLDYSLVDTSISRMFNPIDNLDIKKVQLDSIKLNDVLIEFEKNK